MQNSFDPHIQAQYSGAPLVTWAPWHRAKHNINCRSKNRKISAMLGLESRLSLRIVYWKTQFAPIGVPTSFSDD